MSIPWYSTPFGVSYLRCVHDGVFATECSQRSVRDGAFTRGNYDTVYAARRSRGGVYDTVYAARRSQGGVYDTVYAARRSRGGVYATVYARR